MEEEEGEPDETPTQAQATVKSVPDQKTSSSSSSSSVLTRPSTVASDAAGRQSAESTAAPATVAAVPLSATSTSINTDSPSCCDFGEACLFRTARTGPKTHQCIYKGAKECLQWVHVKCARHAGDVFDENSIEAACMLHLRSATPASTGGVASPPGVTTSPARAAGDTGGEDEEEKATAEKAEEELQSDATESAAETPAVTTPSCVSSLLHVYD